MRAPGCAALQTMNRRAPTGKALPPGGLRAWWRRLWQGPDAPLQQNPALTPQSWGTEKAPHRAPAQSPSGTQGESTRITKETLLRLQPAGPVQEAPPDLLQQRAEFWATATHDLCQPAQALALFLERLRRLPPQASAQALHGYLQSSMEDLTRLLAGLMELAQIDAGEVQAAPMVVSVEELFSRVHEQLAVQAQNKGLRLVVRSKGQSIQGDAALLERILLALGRNAVQCCERGSVLISARPVREGTALRLDVSDSGPGIAERDHRIIFEPFAQRNASHPQGPTRPSLGLYIASRHAALMGTRLQLRSALGRGSRFSITLPLADGKLPSGGTESSNAALEALGLDGLRVVVLDTDTARAAMVGAWLQSWGCVLLDGQSVDGTGAAQALVCAWQPGAPGAAVQHIRALRQRCGSELPACIIGAETGADGWVPDLPAATAVLGQALQAAQLRAWLRRTLTLEGGR